MNMHAKLPEPNSAEVHPFSTFAVEDGAPFRARWRRPVLIGALVVGALILVIWLMVRGKPAEAPPAPALPTVSVIKPGLTTVADAVTASGSIAARRDSQVGIQGEGGRVIAVLVEPGQSVAAGQVLARIDRSVQTQTVAQMQASLRAAEADAALAENELNRAKALIDRGFISKADVDRKTSARDSARAKVNVARALAGQMQAQLARLDVRAPAAGLVLSRTVETGQVVGPGTGGLFRIAEGGVLEMRATVAEQDLARLKVGMAAQITPVGSTNAYPGKIWLLDPVIDPQTRQGVARIALAYAPGLRVGAFASVRIAAGDAARPVLPQSAVQVDDKGSYVYVIDANNKVVRRPITVATVGDAGVAVAAGLNGDERVVVSAGAFLNPGETVKPALVAAAR